MSDYELGRHAEAIESLGVRATRIESKLDSVIASLSERKGERRTLAAVAGGIGGAVSLLSTLLPRLWHHP